MPRHSWSAVRGLILLAVLLAAAGCAETREPITVEAGIITVENLTDREWKNIRVVVNDHFFGGATSLVAGQRLNAPVSSFQTGFGQRFDRNRMSIQKVEVTATDDRGTPVKLSWGRDRTRP